MPTTPTTVYLLGCSAEVQTSAGDYVPCSLIGLFDVVEFLPYEPANYVQSPLYIVAPHDSLRMSDWTFQRWADEPTDYVVDASAFDEQVHPGAWGRMLVQEREMEFVAEVNDHG